MSDATLAALARAMLVRHEGLRLQAYDDATGETLRPGHTLKGHPTIGYGRNLLDPGISAGEAEALLARDIRRAIDVARTWLGTDAWRRLSLERQAVLVDMAFNLGGRLRSFRRLRGALLAADYEAAAREMLDSRWARQVGRRAEELAAIMRGGDGHMLAWAGGDGAAIVRSSDGED